MSLSSVFEPQQTSLRMTIDIACPSISADSFSERMPWGTQMRKLLALAFRAVALAGGISAYAYLIEPAHADCINGNC